MNPVSLVVPVYRNGPCLPELVRRVDATLDRPWRLRFVVDACPEHSLDVALALAGADPRVAVTALTVNVGQHRALVRGLVDEPVAGAWVLLDGDLQDPPEAVPALLTRLDAPDVSGVFAGRRGAYESRGRRITGDLHRTALSRLTGLPDDAGAFFALSADLRKAVVDAVLRRGAPSVVAAAGRSGLPLTSLPVTREVRAEGTSAWTSRARVRQAARTLTWSVRDRWA